MSETNIFKVLSDKQRRDILEMLKDGRMSAGEIAEKMGLSPAALSYHLKLPYVFGRPVIQDGYCFVQRMVAHKVGFNLLKNKFGDLCILIIVG